MNRTIIDGADDGKGFGEKPADLRDTLGRGHSTTAASGSQDMQRLRHGSASVQQSTGLMGLVKSAIGKLTGKKK